MAEKLRWTQEQFDEFFRDPAKWQIEYGPTNSSLYLTVFRGRGLVH